MTEEWFGLSRLMSEEYFNILVSELSKHEVAKLTSLHLNRIESDKSRPVGLHHSLWQHKGPVLDATGFVQLPLLLE